MSVTGTPRMVATQTARGGSSGTGAGPPPRPNGEAGGSVPTRQTGGGTTASPCHAACAAPGSATASDRGEEGNEAVRVRGALAGADLGEEHLGLPLGRLQQGGASPLTARTAAS